MTEAQTLTPTQAALVPVAAFTTRGELDRLRVALNEALDVGTPVNAIKEVLVQLYAYAGFPRSLKGLSTLMEVLQQRQEQGIQDDQGADAAPLPPGTDRVALGSRVQTQLVGQPVTGPLYDFAPAIDEFLKGHLFGDIFARENLDHQTREVATVAGLAGLTGVNSQLGGHMRFSLNTNLTVEQLRHLVTILHEQVGAETGENAQGVLAQLLTTLKG